MGIGVKRENETGRDRGRGRVWERERGREGERDTASETETHSPYQDTFTDGRCTESGSIAGYHLGVVSLTIRQTHVAECVRLLISIELQTVDTAVS